jgi:hypothetical protein
MTISKIAINYPACRKDRLYTEAKVSCEIKAPLCVGNAIRRSINDVTTGYALMIAVDTWSTDDPNASFNEFSQELSKVPLIRQAAEYVGEKFVVRIHNESEKVLKITTGDIHVDERSRVKVALCNNEFIFGMLYPGKKLQFTAVLTEGRGAPMRPVVRSTHKFLDWQERSQEELQSTEPVKLDPKFSTEPILAADTSGYLQATTVDAPPQHLLSTFWIRATSWNVDVARNDAIAHLEDALTNIIEQVNGVQDVRETTEGTLVISRIPNADCGIIGEILVYYFTVAAASTKACATYTLDRTSKDTIITLSTESSETTRRYLAAALEASQRTVRELLNSIAHV